MPYAVKYLGPSDKFVDYEKDGLTWYAGQTHIVDDDIKDRIVDRSHRMVYADSWEAEPCEWPSADETEEETQKLEPNAINEDEQGGGRPGPFASVTQE